MNTARPLTLTFLAASAAWSLPGCATAPVSSPSAVEGFGSEAATVTRRPRLPPPPEDEPVEVESEPITPFPVQEFCLDVFVEDQRGSPVSGAFVRVHPHSDVKRTETVLPVATDEEGTQRICVDRVALEPEGNDVHVETFAGPPYASRERDFARRQTGDTVKIVLCDWSYMGLTSPDDLPSGCF